MKEIAKYSGVLVMIIGVLVLSIPFFAGTTNNTNLLIGLLLVIEGFLGHIFVNNMKRDSAVGIVIWAIILLVVPFALFFGMKKVAYEKDELALYN